jgi:hypothetical protein
MQLLTYRCYVNDFADVWVDDSLAGGNSLENGLRRLVVPAEETAAKEPITESSLVDRCATEDLQQRKAVRKCQIVGAIEQLEEGEQTLSTFRQ